MVIVRQKWCWVLGEKGEVGVVIILAGGDFGLPEICCSQVAYEVVEMEWIVSFSCGVIGVTEDILTGVEHFHGDKMVSVLLEDS